MRYSPVCLIVLAMTLAFGLSLTSCSDATEPAVTAQGKTKVALALNWYPEPEFGGYYAALNEGHYDKQNLDVTIRPGGASAPVIQMIAAGQVPLGIVSADEVVIARSRGAKIVAVYAAYQTCPQGLMVHAERDITSMKQLFNTPGSIAMESGLPYNKFLQKKYPPAANVNVVPYTGGVAQFLNDKNYSQQCFIFSEPLAAKREGANAKVFLVSDEGYNPYTVVVATTDEFLAKHPDIVKAFVTATRAGWASYLKDPAATNKIMAKLNTTMDAQTFADAAKIQLDFIQDDYTKAHGLGSMSTERWTTLANQLVDLGIIDTAPPAAACFKSFDE